MLHRQFLAKSFRARHNAQYKAALSEQIFPLRVRCDGRRRLVDDWTLSDPNPEAYRQALESMSSNRTAAERTVTGVLPTECEPERMVQIAIEVGAMGPQVRAAMIDLWTRVTMRLAEAELVPLHYSATGTFALDELLESIH